METKLVEIKIKGKATQVPALRFNDITVVVTGKFVKIAAVHDEDWLDGQVVSDPQMYIQNIKQSTIKADIFTFTQKIPHIKPYYNYYMEWDNVAAIPIMTFDDWWQRVSTDMRKDVKRAKKKGVVVNAVEFNDELIRGIMEINNDTQTRQGGYFIHYGKDFDTVKIEYSSYLDKSEFLGAYFNDELIGLIKMVYVGELACFMQILSKTKYYDKRPTNALIAKAVEICNIKYKSYLTYGKYYYGNKKKSSLIDFKHRNGFEPIFVPRYYLPLTLKGKIMIRLRLHRGLLGILPSSLISLLVDLRAKFYRRVTLGVQTAKE